MEEKKHIGVTGGTGGLGRKLVDFLLEEGHSVTVLIRSKEKMTMYKENANLHFVIGTLEDTSTLREFIQDITVCCHIAAQVKTADKMKYYTANVLGTKNVCETIRKYNRSCHLIYCSSIVTKDVKLLNRCLLSDYTISKYKAEQVVESFRKKWNLDVTIIYPGYIYGGNNTNFLQSLVKSVEGGLKFVIRGGEKNVPVVNVEDLCKLFYICILSEKAKGKKYCSIQKSDFGMHDLIRLIAKELGCHVPEKVYLKWPFVILCLFEKIICSIIPNRKPKLTMRIVNGLSKGCHYFTEDENKAIGWNQQISIEDGIRFELGKLKCSTLEE